MSERPDPLHDRLAAIAEQVTPIDLLDRSLARSRRIGRNRALATVAGAAVVLALGGGVVWQVAGRPPATVAPATSASATVSASAAPSPSTTSASPTAGSSPVSTGSLPGLTGWLYYVDGTGQLLRLTPTGPVRVLGNGVGSTATISPDDRHIAYVTSAGDTGDLVVTDRDGGAPRTLLHNVAAAGYEPAWSPDSTRLIIARPTATTAPPSYGPSHPFSYGVVTVATGAFTPLSHQPAGIHVLWSADGNHLGYATGTGQIGVCDANGANARTVPVIGSTDHATNPNLIRTGDTLSVNPDATRIAVRLNGGNTPDGDIGRSLGATGLIDTRTGANVTPKVGGTVTALLYRPDGTLLVRHGARLTVLGPDGTTIADVAEPASVSGMAVLAYTD